MHIFSIHANLDPVGGLSNGWRVVLWKVFRYCRIPLQVTYRTPYDQNGWRWMHSLMRAMGPLPPKIGSFEEDVCFFISEVIFLFQVVFLRLFRILGLVQKHWGRCQFWGSCLMVMLSWGERSFFYRDVIWVWDQPGRPKACFVATSYLGCFRFVVNGGVGGSGIGPNFWAKEVANWKLIKQGDSNKKEESAVVLMASQRLLEDDMMRTI